MIGQPVLGLFGIDGPTFLGVYLGLMILAGVVAGIGRSLKLQPFEERVRGIRFEDLSLDLVSFVRGGGSAAIEAALATLLHRGAIEVVSRGDVRAINRPLGTVVGETPLSKLETEVLHELRLKQATEGPEHVTRVDELVSKLGSRIRALEDEAIELGLILRPDDAFSIGRAGLWPWFIVVGLGVIRIFEGAVNQRPVLFLLVLVVLSCFIMLAFRGPLRPAATNARLSDFAAAQGRYRSVAGAAPEMLTVGEVALATAAFGLGPFTAHYLELAHAPRHNGSIGGGGNSCSSSSCGSSCGGGCGGGCGGCS